MAAASLQPGVEHRNRKRSYQRRHFPEGFIGEPAGQLKARAKSAELESGTLTRYCEGLCGSYSICCFSFSGGVRLHQRRHFPEGFIGEPAGQLKARAKSAELDSGTLTRYCEGLCGSYSICCFSFSGRVRLHQV
ncbi:hypothetical protein TYRP_003705 [Tyrophagus putrescentiae]|nr:hypothetical protein TYRP_003705 [Tyrophagus putrescentiae]